jgi:uncharacterized protein (TIGR03435 family)
MNSPALTGFLAFIPDASMETRVVMETDIPSRSGSASYKTLKEMQYIREPATFSHYIMKNGIIGTATGSFRKCGFAGNSTDIDYRIFRVKLADLIRKSKGKTILLALFAAVPLAFTQARAPTASALQRVGALPVGFDVASIKRTRVATDRETIESPQDGDGIAITNMTPAQIIQIAYDFRRRELVSGLPNWATTEKFDLTAKVADTNVAAFRKLTQIQRRQMLQPVLANLFQLKVHTAPKQVPIYALVVGRNGPKLKEAKSDDTYANGSRLADGSPAGAGTLIGLTGQRVTMAALAVTLSRIDIGREVVDQTGLPGKYDFALRCAPTEAMRPVINGQMLPLSADEEALPSIFTAVQEQLGLKLEPTKGLVPTLVIDHIDKPSENE